jgi:hypothetical protein
MVEATIIYCLSSSTDSLGSLLSRRPRKTADFMAEKSETGRAHIEEPNRLRKSWETRPSDHLVASDRMRPLDESLPTQLLQAASSPLRSFSYRTH